MTTTVNRWGTSYGVRLPKSLLKAFPLDDKQKLNITIDGDKIILTRPREQHKSLREYLNEANWDGKAIELTDEDRERINTPFVGEEVEW